MRIVSGVALLLSLSLVTFAAAQNCSGQISLYGDTCQCSSACVNCHSQGTAIPTPPFDTHKCLCTFGSGFDCRQCSSLSCPPTSLCYQSMQFLAPSTAVSCTAGSTFAFEISYTASSATAGMTVYALQGTRVYDCSLSFCVATLTQLRCAISVCSPTQPLMTGSVTITLGANTANVNFVGGSSYSLSQCSASRCLSGNPTNSGTVGTGDLVVVLREWGPCSPQSTCSGDIVRDGVVNARDLAVVLALWGTKNVVPKLATYSAQLWTNWSAVTDRNYPSGGGPGQVIGATRNSGALFWGDGQYATPGVIQLATLANPATLLAEMQSASTKGTAFSIFTGPAAPVTNAFSFTASTQFPYVTLFAPIQPSPGWFLAVDVLLSSPTVGFVQSVTTTFSLCTAGIYSGTTYTSTPVTLTPKQTITCFQQQSGTFQRIGVKLTRIG